MLELGPLAGDLEQLETLLDEGEQARAGRFHFSGDRTRFVLCRAALRGILGGYLDHPPQGIRFGQSSLGKPFVEDPTGIPLQFNLSHSGEIALIAVGSGRRLGVDIEKIQPDRATDDIASRFFSPKEVTTLRALPGRDRSQAFFTCWTRKEAYLKARGDGLSLALDSFSVSLVPGEPAALLHSERGQEEVSHWDLRDLAPSRGYAAALAVEGSDWLLCRWRFSPDVIRRR